MPEGEGGGRRLEKKKTVAPFEQDILSDRLAEDGRERMLEFSTIDPETGIGTDFEGRQWVPLARIAGLFGISNSAVGPRVKGLEAAGIGIRGGKILKAYPLDLVRERLADLLSAAAVDRETGIYTDKDGRRWAILPTLQEDLSVSRTAIEPRLAGLPTVKVRDRGGRITDAYPIDLVRERLADLLSLPSVDEKTAIYTDRKGHQFAIMPTLEDLFGISQYLIISQLGDIAPIKVRGRGTGKAVDAYRIDLVRERLAEFLSIPGVDRETSIYTDKEDHKWSPVKPLVTSLNISASAIYPRLRGLVSIKVRDRSGNITDAYRIDLVRERLAELSSAPSVEKKTGIYTDKEDHQWTALKTLTELLNLSERTISSRLEGLPSMKVRDRSGSITEAYRIDLVRERLTELLSAPEVDPLTGIYTDDTGRQWAARQTLTELFSLSEGAISSRLEGLPSMKVRDRSGSITEAYRIDLVRERLTELLSAPEVDPLTGIYTDDTGRQWAAIGTIAKILGLSYNAITARLKGTTFRRVRDRGGKLVDAYPIELIRNALGPLLELTQNKNNEKELETIKRAATDFVRGIESGDAPDLDIFEKLVSACGSSRTLDVMFRFHPDYKKIPLDYVKNVLAEYLGDYLSVKRPFQLNDITPEVAQHFSDLTLKEGLKETIKQDCLAFYYKERRAGSSKTDKQVIEAYLDHAVNELGDLKNQDIDDVVEEVVEYFNVLFKDVKRPPHMIERLGAERREFPDVNQRINYQELKDKKRLLIADEMGLGKSGSVVFAKEALGVKQALLVVPSNVIPTWQKYLSDSREGGGYFKAGFPPTVQTVETLEDLQREGIEDKEYVIFSHERLSEPGYAEELLKLDFGMLAVDEAHLLKNPVGKRTGQLLELSQKIEGENKYLALLSGTPIPNKVKDVAVTLKLLYPEKFGEVESKSLVSNILRGDLLDLRSLLIPRMQMKSLRESVEMPELREEINYTELEGLEKDIYEMLLEEDELSPVKKLQVLRQFLLNPELVDPTPGLASAKLEALNESLSDIYQTKKKVVIFVNGYVEDILRGEKVIAEKLKVPTGVEVSTIHGEIAQDERIRLQEKMKDKDRKMLLLVSGQTAGVGVDFSGADEVLFYNEPWTKYEKAQQLSRVFRPGLKHDLASSTFIAQGTIEEGIHRHIEAKYKSIQKVLNGIPLTEIEQEMLKAADEEAPVNAEVNPELAEYYFSSWERMMNIFSHVKEMGETNFQEFLGKFSREYAECYMELGSRSYQANANRVTGAVISAMAKEVGKAPHDLKILDTASGPEMLRRHMPEALRDHVISMDINQAHFPEGEGKRVVGSFLHIPLRSDSVDYVAMTLAWHYTNFVPSQGKIERVEALKELHTVLKPGGRAVLNLLYSLDLRKPEELRPALEHMGFRIVDEYSGDIVEGDRYISKIVTIEKVKENTETPEEIVSALVAEDLVDGLKFRKNKRGLRNSRGVLTSFILNGQKREIMLNEDDKKIYEEEQALLEKGERLKARYQEIFDIPREEVIKEGFSRVFNGKRYVLFSKLTKGPGVVVIK